MISSADQLITAYRCFHGNGPYGKIPTKKEPIRTLQSALRLPCRVIKSNLTTMTRIIVTYTAEQIFELAVSQLLNQRVGVENHHRNKNNISHDDHEIGVGETCCCP